MSAKKTCYLLGGKSLLIQCANALKENNFDIRAIVSDDEAIANWSHSEDIPLYSPRNYDSLIISGSVDYLFGITHPEVIPDNILALAKKQAINLHGSLLPDYAGLNVATWALLNQEKTHGITWHEMISQIDGGDILKQVEFDIDAKETALTLDAKCYEAALNSFTELLDEIIHNSLTPRPQQADKSRHFLRCQRIPSMAVINWQNNAYNIDAMIRALDFGPYSNPLGTPKLYLKNAVYYIKEANVVDIKSPVAGKVVSTDGQLTITTNDKAICLTKFTNTSGDEISANNIVNATGLKSGDILPQLDSGEAEILSALDKKSCKHEQEWLEDFSKFEQFAIPYSSHTIDRSNKSDCKTNLQSLATAEENLQALIVLFLSRLCGKEAFNLFLELDNFHKKQHFFVESCIPVNFNINYQSSVKDAIASCITTLTSTKNRGPYCIDLISREPTCKFKHNKKNIILTEYNDFERISQCDNYGLRLIIDSDHNKILWQYDTEDYTQASILRLQNLFSIFISNVQKDTGQLLTEISLLSKDEEDKLLYQWNNTDIDVDTNICIHQLFEQQVSQTPDAIALSFDGEQLNYQQLNTQANHIAHYLLSNNIQPDDLVGILLDRSIKMIVAMIGILKAGAAYLPLDSTYPKDRIEYMLDNGDVAAVICQSGLTSFVRHLTVPVLIIDDQQNKLSSYSNKNPETSVASSNLAYTMYTSGSTGKPKGVMVEHRNVVNFFHGMSKEIKVKKGVWLAVTSISFDISVLEIFWTLANGFEVALYSDAQMKTAKLVQTAYPDKDMQFSLFYWNVAEDDTEYDKDIYRLLIESAKFGDNNGFTALWTPERHFHAFGGLFPNPSVTSAALATITKNIAIRGGSCVVPLHHPIRIAEEWAMVDNFSHGRVGIAIAAGWQPNDFVIMPQNHAEAKKVMFESIQTVKRLWKGETLEFADPNGDMVEVRTLPRPVQKELPVWVTTAGNPDTFKQAGEIGANVLTHLLGQSVNVVADNIRVYREAYRNAGHEGEGHATLLLHTLVGNDEDKVKQTAREPMKKYLKSAVFLVKDAAWHNPAFKALAEGAGKSLDEFFETISDEDMDGLLDFAFERYYSSSGLFGTPERCVAMIDQLKEIGVNEIGCLIDFGLDTDIVLEHLPHLNEIRKMTVKQMEIGSDTSYHQTIAEIMHTRNVTHMQCVPSMLGMLMADPEYSEQLKKIKHIMVGGEAFPATLAASLGTLEKTRVTNMYGPTETTIWSTTHDIKNNELTVPIGRPIANTQIYVLDKYMKPVPAGISGELYISGAGVVRGYYKQPQLTEERFLNNPFSEDPSARMYRTGDRAKFLEDGTLEYLGRIDQQIKIHGYRIEPGEIEALIQQHEQVAEAVVILYEVSKDDKRLVVYIVSKFGGEIDSDLLRSHLQKSLPQFMIPNHYVYLDEIPKTPNGKINRKALPDPSPERISLSDYVAPESELESLIAKVWSEVLKIPQISMNDNFFDLGGHSLTAIQVVHQIRQTLEIDFSLQTIFTAPNLSDMANKIEQTLMEKNRSYDVGNVIACEDPETRAESLMNKIMAMTEEEAEQMLLQQKQIMENQS